MTVFDQYSDEELQDMFGSFYGSDLGYEIQRELERRELFAL